MADTVMKELSLEQAKQAYIIELKCMNEMKSFFGNEEKINYI